MKHEDLEIGMKVKIVSKSVWEEDVEEYLSGKRYTPSFIRENGYGYVTNIGENGGDEFKYPQHLVITVGGLDNLKDGDGDFFIAEDLEPYTELDLIHVTMAEQAFYQFKTLTQALGREDIINEFDHLADATSNYIIEKLGLTRIDFVTIAVDDSLIEECTFDDLLEKLGVEIDDLR